MFFCSAGILYFPAIYFYKHTALQHIKDKWFRLLVILLPISIILYSSNLSQGLDKTKFLRIIVSICCIALIGEGNRFLFYQSNKKFKGILRILVSILAGLLWTMLLIAIATVLFQYIESGTWNKRAAFDSSIIINGKKLILGLWGFSLINSILIIPVLLVAYEIIWHYAQLRSAAREKEKLEKEKLKAELQQLKGIVNPHFLFNNLNSLSSLIAENPQRAQDFLDELTKVFRYLLRNNDTELTTVAQEMNFIQSYYHLLQTRYGQSIKMNIQIDKTHEDLLLPPLTLQLLIENAVKHNRLEKENPLHIDLVTEPGNKLSVKNNLRKRNGTVESTGIGLQNINARYKMLKQPEVLIEKDDQHFTVIISLIDPEKYNEVN